MFKIGDLVTGIDRSYSRSIYELTAQGEDADTGVYKSYAFKGRVFTQKERDEDLTMTRNHNEFRLATDFEIRKASTKGWLHLCNVLFKLGIQSAYIYKQ